MFVRRIDLAEYRNYKTLSLELCEGVNVLTGENAQGKTNFLEAVYLCSIGRSMRTPRDRELIKSGSERARIRAEAVSRTSVDRVDIAIDKRENKRVAINGVEVKRLGELMGVIMTVLFSPDEIAIIKQSPGERRRFMDITICQLSRSYFYLLQQYNRILSQRNRLLKSGAGADALYPWDVQLARAGAKVIRTRRGFIARLNEKVRPEHEYLTAGKEILSLGYESTPGATEAEILGALFAELERTRERDMAQGFTHAGPQTDDFAALSGELDLRKFGSQGQQRTAALSLKLASMELLKDETGEYPVLLLDDVFSELDEGRQSRLIERMRGHQTVVTATHIEESARPLLSEARLFAVKDGCITPAN